MKTLRLNGQWVKVDSLEEASQIVRADIDATGVGSSEWYEHGKTQGTIWEKGKKVAHISYNGRIWPAEVA